MRVFILLACISVALAAPPAHSGACRKVKNVDCSNFSEQKKCDTEGKVYKNQCAFRQASCQNRNIAEAPCAEESGDETTPQPVKPTKSVEEERKQSGDCRKVKNVDCILQREQKRVCDKEGNKYRNICEFKQARCQNPVLEHVECAEESGEETTPVSKPTKSVEQERQQSGDCRRVKNMDCGLQREQKRVCDKEGNKYRNICEFKQARCQNPTLEYVECAEESGDYTTDEPIKPTKSAEKTFRENFKNSGGCRKMKEVDCSYFPKKIGDICDDDGGKHRNMCAFKKARCENPKLVKVDCKPEESGSGDVIAPPSF